MTNVNHYYIDHNDEVPKFDYLRYEQDPSIITINDMMVYLTPSRFSEDGNEIEYSVKECFEACVSQCGFELPTAFAELEKLSPKIIKSFIGYSAISSNKFKKSYGYVLKHIHPPKMNASRVFLEPGIRKTRTIVIPIKIVNEISEAVLVQPIHYDYVGTTSDMQKFVSEEWLDALPKNGELIRIPMPSFGQYLVLDFISSHAVHWVENDSDSENEFIYLVTEI